MDLARKQSPENLTMYLLDFGTNGLAPLTQLPHVADSLLLDQTEKNSEIHPDHQPRVGSPQEAPL